MHTEVTRSYYFITSQSATPQQQQCHPRQTRPVAPRSARLGSARFIQVQPSRLLEHPVTRKSASPAAAAATHAESAVAEVASAVRPAPSPTGQRPAQLGTARRGALCALRAAPYRSGRQCNVPEWSASSNRRRATPRVTGGAGRVPRRCPVSAGTAPATTDARGGCRHTASRDPNRDTIRSTAAEVTVCSES